MTEHELRELIRGIITEVLGAERPKKNALVLFSGALLGFEASLAPLKRLAADPGFALNWTQTPSAERILDQAKIAEVGMVHASQSLVQAHDMLIVPTATVNLIAKVVHGVGDCLASNVMAEFIMSNRPVVVAVNAACPDSADKRSWFPQMPAGYQAMLRQNLKTLASFGVRLTTVDKLDEAARTTGNPADHSAAPAKEIPIPAATTPPKMPVITLPDGPSPDRGTVCPDWVGDYPDETITPAPIGCTQRVISEAVVRDVAPGSVICVGRGAIITPLAREAAAARDITIEKVG